MRKEDKAKIKELVGANKNEKLAVIEFYNDTNECVIRTEEAISYDSWNTIPFEKALPTQDSEFKTIQIIKSLFPSVVNVFAYYECEDGGHIIKDTLESKGWKVINNTGTPMYETSCLFIVSVPKTFKFEDVHEKEVDGIMAYYED